MSGEPKRPTEGTASPASSAQPSGQTGSAQPSQASPAAEVSRVATKSRVDVRRFDAQTRADFQKLHGWCQCVAWWVPTWEGWGERSAEDNARLRESLCARGEYDGYLAYVDGEPAAWAQVGPRERLAKLVEQMGLAPDPGAWAITCFLVAPAFRRRGLARALLAGVIDDARGRGATALEAFPKVRPADEDDLWNGPIALLEEHGFDRIAERGPRLVMRRSFTAPAADRRS